MVSPLGKLPSLALTTTGNPAVAPLTATDPLAQLPAVSAVPPIDPVVPARTPLKFEAVSPFGKLQAPPGPHCIAIVCVVYESEFMSSVYCPLVLFDILQFRKLLGAPMLIK